MDTSELEGYRVHPAADLFPLIEGPEFDSFVADMRTNGQMEPVVVDAEGRLIDGRNRIRACAKLGLAVKEITYSGSNVMQFVISHNLHRRHLSDSQRAMVAGRLATRKAGYRTAILQAKSPMSYDMGDFAPSRAEVATLLNVNDVAINKAKQVIRDGTPDLVALVDSGKVPLTTAARVATTLDLEQQDEYAARVNDGADPVAAAPPDLKQQKHDSNRKRTTGNPPKAPRRKGGQHISLLGSIADQLRVWRDHSLKDIAELDDSVTAVEAVRLKDDLYESRTAITRVIKLLEERTK